jgi:SRSO17 transposase
MGTRLSAPGPQERRFDVYADGLAQAAGHADRHEPLKNYCKGLLLPGERKSVEPMAARLAPKNSKDTRRMHQALHHLVADSPWSDEAMLRQVREQVLPELTKQGPVVAWVVDDTGFPKKGKHSVGVGHQYCGQVGKQDNCQVAVSLSVSTANASLPVAWQLYLPKDWADDAERREKAGVPAEISFQSKPKIAMAQIRQAVQAGIAPGVVLADAAYGIDSALRSGIAGLGLEYVVGLQSSITIWRLGEQARNTPAAPGRPPRSAPREPSPKPVSVKEYAVSLPRPAWKKITWRQGSRTGLQSRFTAVRVRPNLKDPATDPAPGEEWLLIEWPPEETEPTRYWFSNLPAATPLKKLVLMAKHRWIIERDYQELKQELGLGDFEGRNWRGFHHHATLCIAAYGFLVAERSLFFVGPRRRSSTIYLQTPGRLPPAGGGGFVPSGITPPRLPPSGCASHRLCYGS